MSVSNVQSRGVRQVVIEADYAGQRIDNYLLTLLKGVPRSLVYRILRRGEVRVNMGRINASYRLQAGDQVRIPPLRLPAQSAAPAPPRPLLEQLQQAIVYEDERLLVIDKPAGVAVHGGSGLSYGVIEGLRKLRPEARHLELVHRLDRDTSGCLLISKKRSALRVLHELMRENRVDKRYLLLLSGSWEQARADVKAPLAKNLLSGGERMVRVHPSGKPSHTRFRRLEAFGEATLVEAQLFSGRTHQIRVHAAHLGHPVLGDVKYGDDAANRRLRERGLRRLFLHAHSLEFGWPGERGRISVQAPLGPDLELVLQKIREK
jgi:23S rRNA pseudouridine955/2504/2580 synthase